jgi:hypothetical protein
MEILTSFIFGLIILILCIGNIYQFVLNKRLLNDIKKASTKAEKSNSILSDILPGDKVLIKYDLRYTKEHTSDGKDHPFAVIYEANVIDFSKDRVKIKTIDFTSVDKLANDPKYRSGILDFLNGKWIEKSKVELVVDDSRRRENKINKILESNDV